MAVNKDKAIKSVKKRIVPVKDADPHVKILVYGRNGHGKTRFAASGPGKTLIADINEKGTRSVRNYPGGYVFPVRNWEDLTYLYWYLREGDHDYTTVVLDTLTQAQNMCMAHVLKRAEDRDPNRPPAMPDRRSWGQLGELMKPLLLDFRNLQMNVVFVCQARTVEEGEEDIVITRVPDLSPSVRGIAMASVEIMGFIFRKKVRTVKKAKGKRKRKETSTWRTLMLVGPHESYETKDRTGNLGYIIQEPNMQMMIDASFDEEEGQ